MAGKAPRGIPGSKTVSITVCTSKSRSKSQTLLKKGRSCNRTTHTKSRWQRPLGPPAAPKLISLTEDTLGSALIIKMAPLGDGGARIRYFEVIEVDSTSAISKSLGFVATSFPVKAQQSAKVRGLIPGQGYRIAIRAINAIGTSPLSQISAAFLAPNLPGAPSITSAITSSNHSAIITYSPAPSDGGSPITGYTITASPGGMQSKFLVTDSKSYTFTRLSASTTYTFTISATNILGSGVASAPSKQITTFESPPSSAPVAPETSTSPSSAPVAPETSTSPSSAPVAPAPSPAPPSSAPPSSAPPYSAPPLVAPIFTLTASSETRTANTVATGFNISSTGGAIASFAISATPAGMSFSTSTGALSGTPTLVAAATAYTITATNAAGSMTQIFTLTVNLGAASKAMMTTQPAGVVTGSAFTTQPVVRVTDSGGNTITSFTGNVVASIASGSGTLSGTTTVAAVAGIATFTNLVITGAGDHVLTFTPDTLTAVNSETLTVSLLAQATLSITSLTTNTKAHPYSQALSITTSGGSGAGATTFAIASGGTATGCTFSNSTATATITATTVGTCLIQATKAADATYSSASSATATFTFTTATQTITFSTPSAMTVGGSTQTVSPTASSSLTVTLTSTTTGICTVAGFVITAVASGTCSITASQAGNTNFLAATDVIQTLAITAIINVAAIAGVTAPVIGATPVSTTTAGSGYIGAVTWASSGGALVGNFASGTTYTATITLSPTSGYTLTGVGANFFSVAGATSATNSANAGVITAVFPGTAGTISVAAIAGVTAPVAGATPVSTTTVGSGYTGTVTWSGSPGTFASATTYTATITLSPTSGYTLTGVGANFFTVAGATSATNSANAGVITAEFPGTAAKVAITRASVGTAHHSVFTTQPQITIQNSSNNTVTTSSDTVTATVSAGGTLFGTTTAIASSGVATFTNLGIEGIIGTTYTITYTAEGLTVATATVTLTSTTHNGTFAGQVGDTGPGGGIIFYVVADPFSCGPTRAKECYYLEAAPTTGTNAWIDWIWDEDDSVNYAWSGNETNAIGATAQGTAVGSGYANTLAAVWQSNGGATPNKDVTKARAYRGPNNLSDWFLPSKDELNQMCKWANGITGVNLTTLTTDCTVPDPGDGKFNSGLGAAGFQWGTYFSSTELAGYNTAVVIVNFIDGGFGIGSKDTPRKVRVVRAFSDAYPAGFPATPATISVAAIAGVTAPVLGATPVSTTTAITGYTGTVTWASSGGALVGNFAAATTYTATITLTPISDYTLTGVGANFFTVAGATSATNSANTGVITAVFPATAPIIAITRASVGTAHGSAFTTQPQITIQYSGGNTVTSSSAVVTATVSAGGTLVGTTTATASSGVATFTNLGVDGNIGTTYTITYTAEGLAVATATVTLTSTTCDGNTFTCQVGDTGPGGGKIFYVSSGTFTSTGSTCNSACKYLEAAPTSGTNAWTDAGYAWSGNTTEAIGATAQGPAIGTGYANTLAIVGQASGGGTAGFAGTISQAYRGPNNMSDWFLPSKDELNQMCKWQKGIYGVNLTTLTTVCVGGTSNTGSGAAGFGGSSYYRSSSESSATYAWRQDFFDGSEGTHNKSNNYYLVRPVRAF